MQIYVFFLQPSLITFTKMAKNSDQHCIYFGHPSLSKKCPPSISASPPFSNRQGPGLLWTTIFQHAIFAVRCLVYNPNNIFFIKTKFLSLLLTHVIANLPEVIGPLSDNVYTWH